MGKTSDLTDVKKAIIDTLKQEGKTQKEISQQIGCSQSAVSRHLNGKSVGRKQCGRKRCTTRRGDRTLRKIVGKDRFQTLGNLRKQWTESGVETSRATVHRRVQEMGYRCRIPQVLRAQARLTTFYGAFGPDRFSGIAWIEFLNNNDVVKDIIFQLEEMNLTCAQYLWLRHQAEFESKFDEKLLENLLSKIPANISSQELCLWFRNILIPFVRRIVPKGQVFYFQLEVSSGLQLAIGSHLRQLLSSDIHGLSMNHDVCANIFRSALQIIEGTCTDNIHYSITEIQFKTDTRRNEGPARKLTNYEEKGRHERWMVTIALVIRTGHSKIVAKWLEHRARALEITDKVID
ncbi:unnamed protein product [Ranitomeya imitator]|uniref:KNTC1 first ARM-repeats domain-containing protein n=1 Tax=Ranitomeya imitator TaxID=111125 RepID=A0ABN9M831_9NEOB|nr:unnamed protein product [Ranitomeya imitator]